MIRILLDFIILVWIVYIMYIAIEYKEPIFFLVGCIVGILQGYILLKDLRNTSQ